MKTAKLIEIGDRGEQLQTFTVDEPTSRGPWIQTMNACQFHPFDPRPEDIDPNHIAHALSNKCRFGGYPKTLYSVAQHSMLVAEIAYGKSGHDREVYLWGLLHDAAEAYLPDVATPMKKHPKFAFFRELEAQIMLAVCERFHLPPEMPAVVHEADQMALAAEAKELMQPLHPDWKEWIDGIEPITTHVQPRQPHDAKRHWLSQFREQIKGRA